MYSSLSIKIFGFFPFRTTLKKFGFLDKKPEQKIPKNQDKNEHIKDGAA